MKFLLFMLVGLLVIAYSLFPGTAQAKPDGCLAVVSYVAVQVNENNYMPEPRPGDIRKNETIPYVWAEGRYEPQPTGLMKFIPEKKTLFYNFLQAWMIARDTPSEEAWVEAIQAVEESMLPGTDWPTRLELNEAHALLDRAMTWCDKNGKSYLPVLLEK